MPVGRDLLHALKSTAGGPGPPLVLPVGAPPVALLRPVASLSGRVRREDVAALTEWRNRFVRSFLTEFVATEPRTHAWLTGPVAEDDGKILFMADAPDGRTFGYLGLDAIDWEAGRGEADAVVRGGEAPVGAMALALHALLCWARGSLGLADLLVRVLADNRALRFYERLGFVERRRVPLRRDERAGEVAWVESPGLQDAERQLLHLQWAAEVVGR